MEYVRSHCWAWRTVTKYTIIVHFSVICFPASTIVHAECRGGIAEFALSYDIPRITCFFPISLFQFGGKLDCTSSVFPSVFRDC